MICPAKNNRYEDVWKRGAGEGRASINKVIVIDKAGRL